MKVIFEFGFVGIMIFSIILVTKSKKIFKLRSELLFFAIISVLISFVIVVFLKEYILGSVLNSYKNAEMYVHKDIVSRVFKYISC